MDAVLASQAWVSSLHMRRDMARGVGGCDDWLRGLRRRDTARQLGHSSSFLAGQLDVSNVRFGWATGLAMA